MRIAVGFFTYIFTPTVRDRYLKLKADLSGLDTFIVAESGTPITEEFLPETVFFDFEELKAAVPRILGTNLTPGNCHLTMLAFARRHPGYDFYWQVEYDVVFSGSWKTLFDAWKHDPSDLLATHLRTEQDEPHWDLWETMTTPGLTVSATRCRAFFPVYRISKVALTTLKDYVQRGWSGHFEGLIPTVLRHASLTMKDLGEDRFYTCSSCKTGVLWQGTHRSWPPHFMPLFGRNLIYHPVKPPLQKYRRPGPLELLGLIRRRPWRSLLEIVRTFFVELRSRLPERAT